MKVKRKARENAKEDGKVGKKKGTIMSDSKSPTGGESYFEREKELPTV